MFFIDIFVSLNKIHMYTGMLHTHKLVVILFLLIYLIKTVSLAVVGFRKSNKILATLSLLLIIASYGLAEMSKKATKVEITVTEPSELGKSVYVAQCQNCHGPDGKLGMAGAKDLTATNMVKDDIVYLLNNGKNSMPKFNEALSAEEIDAVAEYVLQMKK